MSTFNSRNPLLSLLSFPLNPPPFSFYSVMSFSILLRNQTNECCIIIQVRKNAYRLNGISLHATFPWALSANIPILLPTSLSLLLQDSIQNRLCGYQEVTMYLLKYILRHPVSWGSPSSHLPEHISPISQQPCPFSFLPPIYTFSVHMYLSPIAKDINSQFAKVQNLRFAF